jgi:hypothetical protein
MPLKKRTEKNIFPPHLRDKSDRSVGTCLHNFFVDVSVEIPAIFYACAKRDGSDFLKLILNLNFRQV